MYADAVTQKDMQMYPPRRFNFEPGMSASNQHQNPQDGDTEQGVTPPTVASMSKRKGVIRQARPMSTAKRGIICQAGLTSNNMATVRVAGLMTNSKGIMRQAG